jgi:hypothetical protein
MLYVFIEQCVVLYNIVPRTTKCPLRSQWLSPKEVSCLLYMDIFICCFRLQSHDFKDQIKTPPTQHRYMHHLSSYHLPSQCLPLNALLACVCTGATRPVIPQLTQCMISRSLSPQHYLLTYMLARTVIKTICWGSVVASLCDVSTHSSWLTHSSSSQRSRHLQASVTITRTCKSIICTYKQQCLTQKHIATKKKWNNMVCIVWQL